MTKIAKAASSSVRRTLPARAALCFPSLRSVAVDENVNAAAGPRFPRKWASNGITSSSRSNHGRANVSAAFAGHQSNSRKLSSFHKARCFFQQQRAVRRGRFVAGELDQIASVQKIFEQRFFLLRKRRRLCQPTEELDRGLSRDWQVELFRHEAPKNIGNANAEPIGLHLLQVPLHALKQLQRALPW